MSSIQERLQLKRVPLDTWNVRERLCLASAVVRSGDQNWMSVSRALKTIGEANRPQDWYSQKSCAAQYGVLLEHVETPKRKKRNSEGGVETPQESILKQLTEQRMQEIQNNVNEMNAQYEQLKNEIIEVRNPSTSVDRLQELWAEIEAARRVRERENARRVAWLKEREEKRIKAEKSWHPQPTTTTVQATPSTPSSPLLSSLLKSTPVVTTPQHILHPNNAIETVSPSAGAPTLSLLLEQPQDNKHAAIEHIKSQLVQIEHQFKASTSGSPVPLSAPSPAPAAPAPAPAAPAPAAPAPAVDIDDIEIKAEDVYAFRDIDIHLPPVAAMHKGTRIEKQFKKEDEQNIMDAPQTIQEEDVKVEMSEPSIEPAAIETPSVEILEPVRVESEPKESTPEPEVAEVRISFPEVKFPTPEIKVIQPEDLKIKDEVQPKVEPEPQQEETIEVEQEKEIEAPEEESPPRPSTPLKEEIIEEPRPEADPEPVQKSPEVKLPPEVLLQPEVQLPPEDEPPPVPPLEAVEAVVEPPLEIPTEDIPLPPEPPAPVESKIEEKDATPPPEIEPEIKQEIQEIPLPETEEIKTEENQEDEKRDEDAEVRDLIPLKEMIKEESSREKVKIEEDTHTETDDDTPMELSREEDKDGRTKRDYSRKKKPDSRTCSGSESAPESPSSSEAERQHRLWKKSVMLVYSRLCAHKYASLFLRPITDEEAPGYSTIVKRPMDLSTIRRNIDAGHTRTTAQFQRDVLLMLSNALMYNSSSHSVYTMAKDMFEEAQCQLGMLLAAQAHAGLVSAPPTRKRRPPPAANPNSPQYKAQRM